MKKRGYKTVLSKSVDLKNIIDELNAYNELVSELLKRIDEVTSCHRVTEAELKRDFGFIDSCLRLLKKAKQLLPDADSGRRPTYKLANALRIRVLQPGLLNAENLRTVRKHFKISRPSIGVI